MYLLDIDNMRINLFLIVKDIQIVVNSKLFDIYPKDAQTNKVDNEQKSPDNS